MIELSGQYTERRSFVRIKNSFPLRLRFIDRGEEVLDSYETQLYNVGEGGAFVKLRVSKEELRERLKLELQLPDYTQPFSITAKVCWLKEIDKENVEGIGISFIQIPQQDKEKFRAYILRRLIPLEPETQRIKPRRPRLTERQKRGVIILNHIAQRGPTSKAEISQGTGLNIVTLSHYLNRYIRKGLVIERGRDISSGGRRPSLLQLNPDYGLVIGVDASFAKGKIAIFILNFLNQIIVEKEKEVPLDTQPQRLSSSILELLDEEGIKREKIKAIGLSVSFLGNNYTILKTSLEKEFKIPVLLEGRANSCAYAERWMNPELQKVKDLLYVEGDSCGIILQGDIYRGANLSAGRLGINKEEDDSILRSSLSSEENIERIAMRVAFLVNLLNPQIVVIGGLKGPEVDFPFLRDTIKRYCFEEQSKIVKVMRSHLAQNAAGIGVGAVATSEVFAYI